MTLRILTRIDNLSIAEIDTLFKNGELLDLMITKNPSSIWGVILEAEDYEELPPKFESGGMRKWQSMHRK